MGQPHRFPVWIHTSAAGGPPLSGNHHPSSQITTKYKLRNNNPIPLIAPFPFKINTAKTFFLKKKKGRPVHLKGTNSKVRKVEVSAGGDSAAPPGVCGVGPARRFCNGFSAL